MDKKPCTFCRTLGQNGALWNLKIGNDPAILVHKPCGRKLADKAPKGVEVKLYLSREGRNARRVEDFWKAKFQEAINARAARVKTAE